MQTISNVLRQGISSLANYGAGWLAAHAFAVLALLPAFIAVCNLILTRRSFNKNKAEIDAVKSAASTAAKPPVALSVDVETYRPSWIYTLLGTIALTVIFALVAAIGGNKESSDLGAAVLAAAPASAGHGLAGLVYAGYGAYVYTLMLFISRLNSTALTGKFLAVSAVRSAIALVLGFAVAETNALDGLTDHQMLAALFFVGLFPSWAMDALRQKASQLFKQPVTGCDVLPLCLIDGLDDGIADRLAEIGLWDIQHLAAADPLEITGRTLYPVRRVLDWSDQAILVSYVRSEIVHFRAMGIRGSIDFAALYGDAFALPHQENTDAVYLKTLQTRAAAIISTLSQKTSLSQPCLEAIGRSLYEDSLVNFIWNLWFDIDQKDIGKNKSAIGKTLPAESVGATEQNGQAEPTTS